MTVHLKIKSTLLLDRTSKESQISRKRDCRVKAAEKEDKKHVESVSLRFCPGLPVLSVVTSLYSLLHHLLARSRLGGCIFLWNYPLFKHLFHFCSLLVFHGAKTRSVGATIQDSLESNCHWQKHMTVVSFFLVWMRLLYLYSWVP